MCSFLLSMLPRILESCCTGFNVCSTSLPLLEQPEQWETVLPPLSEVKCVLHMFVQTCYVDTCTPWYQQMYCRVQYVLM